MYNSEIAELRVQRGRLYEEMKSLNDRKPIFNAEDEAKWEKLNQEFNAIDRKIEMLGKDDFMRSSQHEPTRPFVSGDYNQSRQLLQEEIRLYRPGQYPRASNLNEQDHNDLLEFFRNGELRISKAILERFQKRSLQSDKDASGGFLVSPEQFAQQIIATLIDNVFVRKYGTIISLKNAQSLGAPELKTDVSDPTWTSELLIGSEDTSMDFAKRNMIPHPLAKYIKVSKTLVRQNPAIVDFIRQRLAGKIAVVEENNFLNGTGNNSPLGVMVADANGISTARDVSAGNTSTAITADGLINAEGLLKAQYRKNARWAFHRDTLKMIRKLKTGEGDYLWRLGLSDSKPDTILGYPYDESEYMPNTFTTTLYVGILGDWSYYWIVDALDMEIQVLTELYAATNQNGYVVRKETDGACVLEDAFVRVQLA